LVVEVVALITMEVLAVAVAALVMVLTMVAMVVV
jgi:hypothetical protein